MVRTGSLWIQAANRWRARLGGRTALPIEKWADPHADGQAGADAGRPARVLVECDDPAMTWALQRLLGDAGYEVAACSGPSLEANCALVAAGECELQAGADVIVNRLRGPHEEVAALARQTSVAYPELPVIVSHTRGAASVAEVAPAPGTSNFDEPWLGEQLLARVASLTRPARPPA